MTQRPNESKRRGVRHTSPVGSALFQAIWSGRLLSPKKKIVIYISSSVKETSDVESVFAFITVALREKGRKYGVQWVVVDFGHHDDEQSLLDWKSRRKEIERCATEGNGLFFITNQGDKYGTVSLPVEIDQVGFELRIQQLQAGRILNILDEYFSLDLNALAPVYVLSKRNIESDRFEVLREQLKDVVFDPHHGDGGLVVGRSTGEYEFKTALSIVQDNEMSLHRSLRWFHRKIENNAAKIDSIDVASTLKLNNLKAGMEGALSADSGRDDGAIIHSFKVPAEQDQGLWTQHLQRWEHTVKTSLTNCLQQAVQTRADWLQHARNMGVDEGALDEMAYHVGVAREEAAEFTGRDELTVDALRIIGAPSCAEMSGSKTAEIDEVFLTANDMEDHNNDGIDNVHEYEDLLGYEQTTHSHADPSSVKGIALAVVGKSGSGKTAFMAQLARAVYQREAALSGGVVRVASHDAEPEPVSVVFEEAKGARTAAGMPIPPTTQNTRPVIVRFCGLTRDSSSGLALVRSLCCELRMLTNNDPYYFVDVGASPGTDPGASTRPGSEIPRGYDDAVGMLHNLLRNHPCVLFLDGLDRLSDEDLASSKISFLRGVEPHPDTRIIVSTTVDVNHCRTCDSTLMTCGVSRIVLPDFCNSKVSGAPVHAVEPSGMSTDECNYSVPVPAPGYSASVTASVSTANTGPPEIDRASCAEVATIGATAAGTDAPTFVTCEAKEVIMSMLRKQGRRLTPVQLDLAARRIHRLPCTALVLHLVSFLSSKLRSFDCDSASKPLASVNELGNEILHELEQTHGVVFVRAACGFLTWSNEGVSDSEIEDLLSLNNAALDGVCGTGSTAEVMSDDPSLKRIPSSVWCRLRAAMRDLLLERDDGCLRWRNRDFQAIAEMRYGDSREKHVLELLLAKYFGDLVDVATASGRGISRQPLVLAGTDLTSPAPVPTNGVWTAPSRCINLRRLAEGYRHLKESGLVLEAAEELCNLEALYCRFKTGTGRSVVEYFPALLTSLMEASAIDARLFPTAVAERVQHYFRWLLTDRELIHVLPGAIFSSCTRQATISQARTDAEALLVLTSNDSLSNANHEAWVRCRCVGGRAALSPLVTMLSSHLQTVTAVAWSASGQSLASTSTDRTVRVWDASCGTLRNILDGHTDAVLCADWCTDGEPLLATGSRDKTVCIWDTSRGIVRSLLKGHTGAVTTVCWSTDVRNLASGSSDHSILLWHVSNGCSEWCLVSRLMGYTHTMEGHCWTVSSVQFSPDGSRLLAGSSDNIIRIWDVHEGVEKGAFEEHTEKVMSVCWAPDGICFVSGSADHTVNLWDAERHERLVLSGHDDEVCGVGFSFDGTRFASCGKDKAIRVWSFATGRTVEELRGHSVGVHGLRWQPSGARLATAGGDHLVGLWEPRGEELLVDSPSHTAAVYSVAWSPDGTTVVSGSWDQKVALWDATSDSGLCVHTFTEHTNIVYAVTFSPDGQFLASGSAGGEIFVRSVATRKVVVLQGHLGSVRCVSFSPDSKRIASCGDDRSIRIWNAETGDPITYFEGHESVVYCLKFNHCKSSLLATGSWDMQVIIWVVDTGEAAYRLSGHMDSVRCLSWSLDGSQLYSGSHDCTINIWGDEETRGVGDASSWKVACLATFTGHGGGVRALCVTPDGKRLASGSHDCTIRLWCLETRTALLELPKCHTAAVIALAFSPCGRFLASGSHDSSVCLWDACTAGTFTPAALGGCVTRMGSPGSKTASRPGSRPSSSRPGSRAGLGRGRFFLLDGAVSTMQ